MAKRRWASQDDPRLHTPSWLAIRRHWQNLLLTTTKQGGAIYCQAPICKARGIPIQVGGRRGRWHLDVGHIIAREHDPRQTWTIDDTRPEHATCSRSAGVEIGRAKRRARTAAAPARLSISNDDW
jgi:hypothetical protein